MLLAVVALVYRLLPRNTAPARTDEVEKPGLLAAILPLNAVRERPGNGVAHSKIGSTCGLEAEFTNAPPCGSGVLATAADVSPVQNHPTLRIRGEN